MRPVGPAPTIRTSVSTMGLPGMRLRRFGVGRYCCCVAAASSARRPRMRMRAGRPAIVMRCDPLRPIATGLQAGSHCSRPAMSLFPLRFPRFATFVTTRWADRAFLVIRRRYVRETQAIQKQITRPAQAVSAKHLGSHEAYHEFAGGSAYADVSGGVSSTSRPKRAVFCKGSFGAAVAQLPASTRSSFTESMRPMVAPRPAPR
jgi:hypothetical protein